ncbi:MAG: ThuA domain-containing protein [Chitinophagaceae bacterium]
MHTIKSLLIFPLSKNNLPLAIFLFLNFLFLWSCSASKSSGGPKRSGSIRTLIVGGGSSHNFNRWYKQADSITLSRDGLATVTYTSGMDSVLTLLPQTDVLLLSNNQPMQDPNLRKAIFDFVESGKGLVIAHAGTWYNYKDWPEYNSMLVGGGTRGHEKYGSFDFTVTDPNHPITKNVATSFNLKDELYRMIPDSTGPGIQVLAVATIPGTQTRYPQLWVTKSNKARIVGFTLGHDGEAHDLPAYQSLLRNAVTWAAKR